MNLSCRFSVLSAFACAAATVAHAGMVTIEFDESVIGPGPVSGTDDFFEVTDQYNSALYGGLVFSSDKYGTGEFGLRIYDTNYDPSVTPGKRDPDLESPYTIVDPLPWQDTDTNQDLSNILIIQERATAPADDNASGGQFIMTWAQPVIVNRLLLVDFEDASKGEIYTLTFDGGNAFTSSGLGSRLGDNKIHGVDEGNFGTYTINQLILDSTASGAIASISFTVVPEPSSLLFLGTFGALAALFLRRRR